MASNKLPKIKISRKFKRLSTPELGATAKGIVFTNDPDATSPIYTDTQIYGLADDMLNTHISRQTNPSKELTAKETLQRNTLTDALDDNANCLEIVANRVAKNEGDINAGLGVVKRIGYQIAGRGSTKRNVGFVNSGVGWAQAHEEKSKKGIESHVWEGGITTAKGTPPTVLKSITTCEADCVFNNLPSGAIFAYHHASVVPVSHTSKNSTTGISHSSDSKTATLIPMNKGRHPIFNFNTENLYQFGEWRYITIP